MEQEDLMTHHEALEALKEQKEREAEILARIKQAMAKLQEALDIIQGGKR